MTFFLVLPSGEYKLALEVWERKGLVVFLGRRRGVADLGVLGLASVGGAGGTGGAGGGGLGMLMMCTGSRCLFWNDL